METLVERGCGLDVHQATVVACLLMVRKDGKVQKQVRTFGTTTRELLSMREWLLSQGCTHVAMESTGVYWKPIYAILEGAFEIVIANAQHESCLSTVQRVARNVKRWREGDQPLRWTATGLLEAEKKFRHIKGYQEILLLKERLNPSRLPQKEVRAVEVA